MNTYNLILERRTIRKFQDKPVPYQILEKCINAARVAPSGANLQPLEFVIIDRTDLVEEVFSTLKWAGYLEGWEPAKDERPAAYIVVISNERLNSDGRYDVGMAVENMLLTALEDGIGSCGIGSIDKNKIRRTLNIPKFYSVELVVALGYPAEESVIVEFSDSVKYWRDQNGVMHVPKRRLDSVLHKNSWEGA
jgi:nitroreductase